MTVNVSPNMGESPAVPPPLPGGPTAVKQRIVAIDVLRGFALLGILLINIRSFTMIEAAYMNPGAVGLLKGIDHVVWWLTTLLAEQKFMSLFAMLFGAGMVLMYERRDRTGLPSARVHYRRMAGLFVIGLLHAYVLWYGDVLVLYAICGCGLFLVRKLKAGWLFALGTVFLLIGAGISGLFGLTIPLWDKAAHLEYLAMVQPNPTSITDEVNAYRGGWFDHLPYRATTAAFMHLAYIWLWGIWRAGGMMLLGMGLMKLGVLRGTASTRTYVWLVVMGLMIGLPLALAGQIIYPASQRYSPQSFYLGGQWNYFGSIFMSIAYAAIVMLIARTPRPRKWLAPLAAVGRTALSNYIGQTILCTSIFYGTFHNFDLFGRISWTQQMYVVASVWVVQLIASPLWLRYFTMGPLEAIWRAATYGCWPTMRVR